MASMTCVKYLNVHPTVGA